MKRDYLATITLKSGLSELINTAEEANNKLIEKIHWLREPSGEEFLAVWRWLPDDNRSRITFGYSPSKGILAAGYDKLPGVLAERDAARAQSIAAQQARAEFEIAQAQREAKKEALEKAGVDLGDKKDFSRAAWFMIPPKEPEPEPEPEPELVMYGIIQANSAAALAAKVNESKDKGWKPQGGLAVAVFPSGTVIYAQAVFTTRKESNEPTTSPTP